MNEHFIVYDTATGDIRWRGEGAPGTAAKSTLDAGLAVVLVPREVIAGSEVNLPLLKQAICLAIDTQAETVRMRFLTPGSGQALTYQRKEAEARAWTADSTAPAPFLGGEAAGRGMTLADLAAEVIQQADAWIAVGSAIEGMRMGAKADVASAGTFGAIVAAATINWDALRPSAA